MAGAQVRNLGIHAVLLAHDDGLVQHVGANVRLHFLKDPDGNLDGQRTELRHVSCKALLHEGAGPKRVLILLHTRLPETFNLRESSIDRLAARHGHGASWSGVLLVQGTEECVVGTSVRQHVGHIEVHETAINTDEDARAREATTCQLCARVSRLAYAQGGNEITNLRCVLNEDIGGGEEPLQCALLFCGKLHDVEGRTDHVIARVAHVQTAVLSFSVQPPRKDGIVAHHALESGLEAPSVCLAVEHGAGQGAGHGRKSVVIFGERRARVRALHRQRVHSCGHSFVVIYLSKNNPFGA
mmetsp:Transcript_48826/g.129420  ORF Transcript_48826/g.129420 Transcript_48826/m.129420 type:complete len:298 (+) Transcript_48826:563-1456(+)